MSAIYFHSKDGSEARLSGSERALMGVVVNDLAWPMLRVLDKSYRPSESLRDILPFINKNDYIHGMITECLEELDGFVKEYGEYDDLKGGVAKNSYFQLSSDKPKQIIDSIKIAFRVGLTSQGLFLINEKPYSSFSLGLNTVMSIGSQPLQLFARLHAQCEIHCYVRGLHRDWLAGVIEDGLECGLYREGAGWDDVIKFLRKDKDNPIVCSYSVCESFPNGTVSGFYDKCKNDDYEKWDDLSCEEQWDMSIKSLIKRNSGLELSPKKLEVQFDENYNLFDLNKMVEDKSRENREARENRENVSENA